MMSRLTVEIEDGRTAFSPGETIRGTASWQLDQAPEEIEVRLFWYTQGKGDQDVGGVKTERVPAPGSEGSQEFAFAAPRGPHSFSGKLISVVWAVELVALPSRDAARQDLVIAPGGREIRIATAESLNTAEPLGPS